MPGEAPSGDPDASAAWRRRPANGTTIAPANDRIHLPVQSTITPNSTGVMTPAVADPVFTTPLVVPASSGAMSIGSLDIGPITISWGQARTRQT
jgi:hypothetical protein